MRTSTSAPRGRFSMGDGRRLVNLVLILTAIAAGIIFGVWTFEAIAD